MEGIQPPSTQNNESRRILTYITQNASSTKWDFTNQNITSTGAKKIVDEIKLYKQIYSTFNDHSKAAFTKMPVDVCRKFDLFHNSTKKHN